MTHKQQFIVTKEKSNLAKTNSHCVIDYKDFKGYLDTTVHYRLEGDYCAFINGIKTDFKYDELMGRVKPQYKDSFGRIINVTKIN